MSRRTERRLSLTLTAGVFALYLLRSTLEWVDDNLAEV